MQALQYEGFTFLKPAFRDEECVPLLIYLALSDVVVHVCWNSMMEEAAVDEDAEIGDIEDDVVPEEV
jgi:hypothetical protein